MGLALLVGATACGESAPARSDTTLKQSTPTAPIEIAHTPPPTLSESARQSPHSPCGGMVHGYGVLFADFENLVWASHEVIAGTVTKTLGPAWGPPISPDLDPNARYVFTDYLVSVDARVRVGERTHIVVRRLGGTIGDCTVLESTDALEFRVGQRYLLFLYKRDESLRDGTPLFEVTGSAQGLWRIDANGAISGGSERLTSDAEITSFGDVAERIVVDLIPSKRPSVAEVDSDLLVPIAESPVVDDVPSLPTPGS